MNRTAQRLRWGRAYLEKWGWIQHPGLEDTACPQTPTCMVIACHYLSGEALPAMGEERDIDPWLLLAKRTAPENPAVWNDAPGRTVEEVMALISDAIEEAEAQG
jgi:hypothetical protein